MTQPHISTHFPYLQIHVTIGTAQHADQELDVEVLIDTGFDGGVCISPGQIDPAIRPDARLPWVLADGSEVRASAYLATVRIGSLPAVTTIAIALGEEPLLGREVTDRFRVTFDHGTQILVEP